ncbi:MAG TPA: M48 family metalloprotease, partial [Longimicrobium sp.]
RVSIMDPDLFRQRAARCEALARRHRTLYRLLLVLLVALGYAYVLVVLGSALLLALGVVGLLLAVTRNPVGAVRVLGPVGEFSMRVGRALWVRVDPPEGIPVTAAQAPQLFAMIGELRRTLRTRPVHVVLVSGEVNAGMMQVPRLGIFGWHRNYLQLGLPLLQGLSSEQARAVVAHELAHLSARHSRRTVWVYRVRQTWHRLAGRLAEDGQRPSGIFGAFFRWYVPFFDAFTLVESRENELEADRLAASAAGRGAMAAALARVAVLDRYDSDVFWPSFTALVADHPAPPHGPLAVRQVAADERASHWLRERLEEPNDAFQTHPQLGTRLQALEAGEMPPEALGAPERSAAELWLGPLQDALSEQLDRAWIAAAREGWARQHHEIRAGRERLDELDRLAGAGSLDAARALERTWLLEQHRKEVDVLPLYADLAAAAPGAAAVRYHLGRVLLARGDEAGLAHLQAAAMERELVLPASEAAYGFLLARGRTGEARAWLSRAQEAQREDSAAREERRALKPNEAVLPHAAGPQEVERLRALLETFPAVRAAYLVRRVVRHRPDLPSHILVLDLGGWLRRNKHTTAAAVNGIAQRIDFLGHVWVVAGHDAGRSRKASRVPGALIYRWDRSRGSVPAAELALAR